MRFRSFNHSTCKTVLNLLEAVYLRLRKIVVERVTEVKFRVDNRDSNGTDNSLDVTIRFATGWNQAYNLYRFFQDIGS